MRTITIMPINLIPTYADIVHYMSFVNDDNHEYNAIAAVLVRVNDNNDGVAPGYYVLESISHDKNVTPFANGPIVTLNEQRPVTDKIRASHLLDYTIKMGMNDPMMQYPSTTNLVYETRAAIKNRIGA